MEEVKLSNIVRLSYEIVMLLNVLGHEIKYHIGARFYLDWIDGQRFTTSSDDQIVARETLYEVIADERLKRAK